MDLGFALRRDKARRTPELAVLLGRSAARQAATPTARTQARIDNAVTQETHIPLFADGARDGAGAAFTPTVNDRQPC